MSSKREEILERALRRIMTACEEGQVCDDVAWFDQFTTLHDFCAEQIEKAQNVDKQAILALPLLSVREDLGCLPSASPHQESSMAASPSRHVAPPCDEITYIGKSKRLNELFGRRGPNLHNADEVAAFMSEWLRVENGDIHGIPYIAVQIAEAADREDLGEAARLRAMNDHIDSLLVEKVRLEARLDEALGEVASMRAREDIVGKRVATGFMTCISGGGGSPRVQIVFKELRDADLLHDALIALENGHRENLAMLNAKSVSDEHALHENPKGSSPQGASAVDCEAVETPVPTQTNGEGE